MCVMMTEIKTINGGQKDALLWRANIKKMSYQKSIYNFPQKVRRLNQNILIFVRLLIFCIMEVRFELMKIFLEIRLD